jgi:hypothetical protein
MYDNLDIDQVIVSSHMHYIYAQYHANDCESWQLWVRVAERGQPVRQDRRTAATQGGEGSRGKDAPD